MQIIGFGAALMRWVSGFGAARSAAVGSTVRDMSRDASHAAASRAWGGLGDLLADDGWLCWKWRL
jgi:hypothetical protein